MEGQVSAEEQTIGVQQTCNADKITAQQIQSAQNRLDRLAKKQGLDAVHRVYKTFSPLYLLLILKIPINGFKAVLLPYCLLEIFILIQPNNYYDCNQILQNHNFERQKLSVAVSYNYRVCWKYVIIMLGVFLLQTLVQFFTKRLQRKAILMQQILLLRQIEGHRKCLTLFAQEQYEANNLDSLLLRSVLKVSNHIDSIISLATQTACLIICLVAIGLYISPQFYNSLWSLILLLPLANFPYLQIKKQQRSIEHIRVLRQRRTFELIKSLKYMQNIQSIEAKCQNLIDIRNDELSRQSYKSSHVSAIQTIYLIISPVMILLIFATMKRYQKMKIYNAYIMIYIFWNISDYFMQIPRLIFQLKEQKISSDRINAFFDYQQQQTYIQYEASSKNAISILECQFYEQKCCQIPRILDIQYQQYQMFQLFAKSEEKYIKAKLKARLRQNKGQIFNLFTEQEYNMIKQIHRRRMDLAITPQICSELSIGQLEQLASYNDYRIVCFIISQNDDERTKMLKQYAQIAYLRYLAALPYKRTENRTQSPKLIAKCNNIIVLQDEDIFVDPGDPTNSSVVNTILQQSALVIDSDGQLEKAQKITLLSQVQYIRCEEKQEALWDEEEYVQQLEQQLYKVCSLKKQIIILDNSQLELVEGQQEQMLRYATSVARVFQCTCIFENFKPEMAKRCKHFLCIQDRLMTINELDNFVAVEQPMAESRREEKIAEMKPPQAKLPDLSALQFLGQVISMKNREMIGIIVLMLFSLVCYFYSLAYITSWTFDLYKLKKQPTITSLDIQQYSPLLQALANVPATDQQLYKDITLNCYVKVYGKDVRFQNAKNQFAYIVIFLVLTVLIVFSQHLGYKRLSNMCTKTVYNAFLTLINSLLRQPLAQQSNSDLQNIVTEAQSESSTFDTVLFGTLQSLMSGILLITGNILIIAIFDWPQILVIVFFLLLFALFFKQQRNKQEIINNSVSLQMKQCKISTTQPQFLQLLNTQSYNNDKIKIVTEIMGNAMNLLFITIQLSIVPISNYLMTFSLLSIISSTMLTSICQKFCQNTLSRIGEFRRFAKYYLRQERLKCDSSCQIAQIQ